MRSLIRDKFRAHMKRRRRRESHWSAEAIAAACLLYFGGALGVGFLDAGWMLAGWLALGGLLIARFAYHREPMPS